MEGRILRVWRLGVDFKTNNQYSTLETRVKHDWRVFTHVERRLRWSVPAVPSKSILELVGVSLSLSSYMLLLVRTRWISRRPPWLPGLASRTESSAWVYSASASIDIVRVSIYTLTCFFKSWGRLNALPQNSHLCGLRGTWTRICEVMWSRLTVVVRHWPQAQVRFRLFVDFLPTWTSQRWFFTKRKKEK